MKPSSSVIPSFPCISKTSSKTASNLAPRFTMCCSHGHMHTMTNTQQRVCMHAWPYQPAHACCVMLRLVSYFLLLFRNMSISAKESWQNTSRRSQVSKTLTERPKVCSYCGTTGHNRRGCPKLHPDKQYIVQVRATSASLSIVQKSPIFALPDILLSAFK